MSYTTVKLDIPEISQVITGLGLEIGGPAQIWFDNELLKLSDIYVPLDKGDLKQSGIDNTILGQGMITYSTPYARRLWFGDDFNFVGAPIKRSRWTEWAFMYNREALIQGIEKIIKG